MPLLALLAPCSVWQTCKPKASVSLACQWPLDHAAEQGHPRLKVVRVCWSELVQEGEELWGSQSALLAFTSSPRIPKFFSNLQLLDVGANHQRGLPRADPPPYHRSFSPPPYPPITPPPECRLIQASSLIHVFIYYFIGCVWAGEIRHLVVRTVINSLKPLLSDPSLSLSLISILEESFLLAQTHTGLLPLLGCPLVSFTLYSHFYASFSFTVAIMNPPLFLTVSSQPINTLTGQVLICDQRQEGKRSCSVITSHVRK